jgi:D-alanyl-D-alanine carboxypeptidase
VIKIILIFTFVIVNLSQLSLAKIATVIGNPITNEIYFEVNKNTRNYPASLTKIMTLYIVFDELNKNNLNLNDKIVFSKKATQQQPSKLNIPQGKSITVDQAIDALIVKSANDVAIAVAEKISGSEKAFVKKMNLFAKNIGLKNTNFANPHGLPNKSNLSSAYDIFILSSELIKQYPEYLNRFKRKKVTINGKTYKTHNTLLNEYDYYIGLKTGYIRKSGFQISLLSSRDDNYLLGVYFGGNSSKERNSKIHFLMNKYQNKKSINKNIYKSSNSSNNYIIETSSFKKISDSKKHISFLQKKMFFLKDYYHHIRKRGNFFVSFFEMDSLSKAKFLCNEMRKEKLDCIVKAS